MGAQTGDKRPHRGLAPIIRKTKLNYPKLTDSEIARRVNCTPENVTGVLRTFLGKNTISDLRDYQENRADVFDSLTQRFLESVTEKKIVKTSAAQLVTMAAILHDKSQVMRGQATQINVTVLMDVVAAIKAKQGQ